MLMRRRGRLCAVRFAGERVCRALGGSGVCATVPRSMRKTCASMCGGRAGQCEAAGRSPRRSCGKGRRRAAHKHLECVLGQIDERKRQRRLGQCSPRLGIEQCGSAEASTSGTGVESWAALGEEMLQWRSGHLDPSQGFDVDL